MTVGITGAWAIDATAESSYGTAATTPDKSHPIRMERPRLVVATVDDMDSLTGVYGEGLAAQTAKKHAEAPFEMDLRLDALATYAKFAFGSLSTGGAGPYTHTITQNVGDAPSFTGYWKDPKSTSGKSDQHVGCKAESLTLRGSAGGKLTMAVAVMASGTVSEQTVTMPAINTDAYALMSGLTTFTIGGSNYLTALREFEINIRNRFNRDGEYVAGNLVLPALERTGFSVDGRFLFHHTETSLTGLFSDVENQTNRAIVLAGAVGSDTFTLTIRKAFFDDTSTQGQRDKVFKPVTFRGMYSSGDSEVARLVVANSVAAYT